MDQQNRFDNAGANENRSAPRRSGNQIKVVISDAKSGKVLMEGWVIDRSLGGLNLLVPEHIVPTALLSVRRVDAAPDIAPLQVEVRRCEAKGLRFQLGCKFVGNPPENRLVQFG